MPNKKPAASGNEKPPSNPGDTPELKPETLDELMKEQGDSDAKTSEKPVKESTPEPADPTATTTSDEPAEGTVEAEDASEEDAFKTPDEVVADDADLPEESGETERPQPQAVVSSHLNKWGRLKNWCSRHKVVTTLLSLLILLGALAGIPWTRYAIGGLFLKQTISIEVMDSQTHKAVTSATVSAKNVTIKTNNKGLANLKLPIGKADVKIEKIYYKTVHVSAVAPVLKPKKHVMVNLQATGRQVPIVVINSLSGKPVENAVVMAANTEVKTGKDGHATMVLPTTSPSSKAMIHATGYNDAEATIQVTGQTLAINTIRLTPSGTTYFLSNQSGRIDVVKTNLDGSNRKVVMAGTGKEDARNTVLLASRDWKYLALLSKRDGGDYAKLFLIDTSTDKVTTMDEGQANFSLVGWHSHTFVYEVTRVKQNNWQDGFEAAKSYDAQAGKLVTIDQTQASGSSNFNRAYQSFSNFYITDAGVVYSVTWDAVPSQSLLAGKANAIRLSTVDGKSKKDVKTFDPVHYGYMQATLYEPQGIYYAVYNNDANQYSFYEYENQSVKTLTNYTQADYDNQTYVTYLYSPSGNHTLWSELRDGKNTILIGDKDGKNGSQVLKDSDYTVYGWYTEDYILLSKNSSELYSMPAAGGTPHKISNYYKPDVNFRGYGYGYGGL